MDGEGKNQSEMTELSTDIRNKLNQAKWEITHSVEAASWRSDPKAREARKELLILDQSMNPDPDIPPKVLKVETKEGEYISIRRGEGNNLYLAEDSNGIFGSKTLFNVAAKDLPDGAIGVLLVPTGASCKNNSILEEFPDEDVPWSYMEYLLSVGVKYNSNDWKVDFGATTLVKRIGNNFYILDRGKSDKYDHQPIISKINPIEGKLQLYTADMYLSEEEIKVKRDWYNTRARFYVLIKGSTTKETSDKKIYNLIPQTAKVAV